MELSAAFPEWTNKENAALQCRAVVLNINIGYNKEVMEKCKKLKEYALFIAKIRDYLQEGYNIDRAVDFAIDECIAEGILEQILREEREEVRDMLLTEYDEQAHIKNEKDISFEEGREEGRESLSVLIQKLLAENRLDDVNRVTSDKEYCEKLMKEFKIS